MFEQLNYFFKELTDWELDKIEYYILFIKDLLDEIQKIVKYRIEYLFNQIISNCKIEVTNNDYYDLKKNYDSQEINKKTKLTKKTFKLL